MDNLVANRKTEPYLKTSLNLTMIPGVLLGILGGGVPPSSPNPDPISDQKNVIFTLVFRPGTLRNYVII